MERGFQNTTTHEICQKAQVNGAAINYHFGSKEQLYLAVLEEAFRRRDDVNVLNPLLSPEDQFRSLIRLLCMDIFSEDKPAWHKRLVALEMVGPTEALKVVIEKIDSSDLYQYCALHPASESGTWGRRIHSGRD